MKDVLDKETNELPALPAPEQSDGGETFGDANELELLDAEYNEPESEVVDESKEKAKAAYDDMKSREQNGGALFPFDPVIAQSAGMMCGVGFSMVAAKRGQHWAITQDQAKELGIALAQVIQHYAPDLEPSNPLANLAFVGGAIVGPKLAVDAMQARREKTVNQKSQQIEGPQDGDESANQ